MPYTDLPARRSSMARRSLGSASLRDPSSSNSNMSRRASHVRFNDDQQEFSPPSQTPQEDDHPPPPPQSGPPARPDRSFSRGQAIAPEWHFPVYQNNYPSNYPAGLRADIGPTDTGPQGSANRQTRQPPADEGYDRRGSDDSDNTLFEGQEHDYDDSQYSYSSYRHPYDIPPPPNAYGEPPYSRVRQRSVSFSGGKLKQAREKDKNAQRQQPERDFEDDFSGWVPPREDRRRGFLSNLIELYGNGFNEDDDSFSDGAMSRENSQSGTGARPWHLRRQDSLASDYEQVLDPDDPRVTGERKNTLDDPEDIEKNVLRQMSYKARRKERQRIRIEFNITSVLNRQKFLMRLARALMTFGAPSHRIESQLLSAARILEVDAEFIHIPGVIICSFGDQDTKTSETHFVKCGGRLSLGSLHDVHQIYRSVVHDEVSAKQATKQLQVLLDSKPLYPTYLRCILAFFLSALICPLAFGGSFVDMWIAGAGAAFLFLMQTGVATKSQLYANVFEITMTIFISFLARGLSSIRSQIFCYTAISSAGIVGILPGYLILSSSLELASKNIVCGSVKMVYALIYTLFLGFGLQIGSDFYLLFDQSARHDLSALAARLNSQITISGTFVSDNGTFNHVNDGQPLSGSFTFTNSTPLIREHIHEGCYRPPNFPWYLQPFPWWTQFIIVPLFSISSSLANLQPFFTIELIVMVVISCISYAANKVANHFIFGRSDIVSAIGAFAVGLLGNIYSRRMGGTAFTSMVTGVLFLVPSGLSQAGGITAQGNGIDIGGAMIAVTIGITVGLFMSQAMVYMFGSRKNAAIFSF